MWVSVALHYFPFTVNCMNTTNLKTHFSRSEGINKTKSIIHKELAVKFILSFGPLKLTFGSFDTACDRYFLATNLHITKVITCGKFFTTLKFIVSKT